MVRVKLVVPQARAWYSTKCEGVPEGVLSVSGREKVAVDRGQKPVCRAMEGWGHFPGLVSAADFTHRRCISSPVPWCALGGRTVRNKIY